MPPEAKLGMLLGLICVILFAIVNAGPRTNPQTTPTPDENQGSPRISIAIPDT